MYIYMCVCVSVDGYAGLFSMLLKNPTMTSAPFYDRLHINKGPSLGTWSSIYVSIPHLSPLCCQAQPHTHLYKCICIYVFILIYVC